MTISRLERTLLLSAVVGIALASLWPLLYSGYYSDDLVNSTIRGSVHLEGSTLWRHMYEAVRLWLVDQGRVASVALLATLPISYFLTDQLAHKSAVLFLVGVDLLLFFTLLRLLAKDFNVACLGLLFLAACFQFRLYHDPFLSFSGLMQTFTAITLVAAIAFLKYLETAKSRYLWLSFIAYNLTLYFYEISLALAVVFPILALEKINWFALRQALRKSAPHLISAGVAALINVLASRLRDPAATEYQGTSANLQPGAIAVTLAEQLVASFPLSYALFDPANLLRQLRWTEAHAASLLIAFAFAALCWRMAQRVAAQPTWRLPALGLALLVFPALPIALSGKYQAELEPGIGYIPVYLQYFGLTLIALFIWLSIQQRLSGKGGRVARFVLCALLAVACLRNVENNRAVVAQANIELHFRYAALATALDDGLLATVPENAVIVVLDEYRYQGRPWVKSHLRGWADGYPWKSAAFVFQHSGRRFKVVDKLDDLDRQRTGQPISEGSSPKIYTVRIHSYPQEQRRADGYVVLSRVDSFGRDASGALELRESVLARSAPLKQ